MFYLTCEGNATELLEKAATDLILHFSITRDLEQMLYFLHLLVRLHESNHLWCLWLLIALPLYHIAFECLLVSYFETWFMIVVSYNGRVMTLVKSLYVYLVKLKLHYVKHHFVFQGHVYILRFWACYYDLHPHARFSASQAWRVVLLWSWACQRNVYCHLCTQVSTSHLINAQWVISLMNLIRLESP